MDIIKKLKNWCPQPTKPTQTNGNQNTKILRIDGLFAKTTVAVFSSLAFVALAVTAGFSLSTGRDFRVLLTFGALLFALPFGYSVYRTYVSMVGFVAFGFAFLLSIIAGFSTVNTMLFSLSACLGTALILTLAKACRKGGKIE